MIMTLSEQDKKIGCRVLFAGMHKAILATNDNLEDFDCQDDEVHLGYDEQDEKIGRCVLFTGKATGNYGNLADVNLSKKIQRSPTSDPGFK